MAPAAVSVTIELPHGPVVESPVQRGFRAHVLDPKRVDRHRNRFSLSDATDDSHDAHVLADASRADPCCLRLEPLDVVVELREGPYIVEDRRHDRDRVGHRA